MERGEYRPIYTVLIDDPDFQKLSRDAKLLFFVLKLSLGPSGIGVVYDPVLASRTGIPSEGVREGMKELSAGDWVRRQATVVWIRNGLAFEPNLSLENSNHRKSIEKHLRGLPKLEIVNSYADYYDIDRPFDGVGAGIPSEGVEQGVLEGIGDQEIGERRTENGERETNTGDPEDEIPRTNGRPPAPSDLEKDDSGRYRYPAEFETAWDAYPDRTGGNPKKGAYRAWRARVADGVDPDDLADGVESYAAFCRAEGIVGTRYVKQARTFFGPDGWWDEDWDPNGGGEGANARIAAERERLEDVPLGGDRR